MPGKGKIRLQGLEGVCVEQPTAKAVDVDVAYRGGSHVVQGLSVKNVVVLAKKTKPTPRPAQVLGERIGQGMGQNVLRKRTPGPAQVLEEKIGETMGERGNA